MFIPNELRVNKDTYPKHRFFRDVNSSIRFQTPIFPLKAIVREDNPLSPLNRVKATIDHILAGNMDDEELNQRLVYELRMYAQIVRSNLRSQVNFLASLCPRDDSIEIVMESLQDLVATINTIQDTFHDLEATFFTAQMPEKTRSCYMAADEYVSYYIEHYFTMLVAKMEPQACFKVLVPDIHDLIARRQFRRRQKGYTLVLDQEPGKQDATGLAKFHYWKSFLKSYIKEVLFLDIRESEERKQLTQLVGGVAAFIAMGFTVFLTVMLLEGIAENSLPFIFLLLVGYVLKDRIKSFVNLAGEKLLAKYIPDKKYDIVDPMKRELIGTCEESMRFVHSVPDHVLEIRNKDRHNALEREFPTEQAIHYHKHIKIYTSKIFKIHERHKNINDIITINIRDFLVNAWDPREEILHFNVAKDTVEAITVPVEYHLNMVLKQTYFITKKREKIEKVKYKRLRVVFTKDGIASIEDINI